MRCYLGPPVVFVIVGDSHRTNTYIIITRGENLLSEDQYFYVAYKKGANMSAKVAQTERKGS